MSKDFTFAIKKTRFDEHYTPSDNTRITTNFANLARGQNRQENLRHVFRMINDRFNALAQWDNPTADRYAVQLDIITVDMRVEAEKTRFPVIEVLKTTIIDQKLNRNLEGIVGNNFSSYVRDYDFSVVLPEHNQQQTGFHIPDDFGDVHGAMFKAFLCSDAYRDNFDKPPVICLSVSSQKTYHRSENYHPILGYEYLQPEYSLTDLYFKKMGLNVRYFMPPNAVAPLAFYFSGDLLNDYTNLELISTLSTMETFQKIYRPEIYNAHAAAGKTYQPSLVQQDYALTPVVYDREERSRLAVEQGKFAEANFITPYQHSLKKFFAHYSA